MNNNLTLTPTDELVNMIREAIREEIVAILPSESRGAPLDKRTLAYYLGISISTLEKLMKSGDIKYFNIGNQPRFTWKTIDAYIKTKESEI